MWKWDQGRLDYYQFDNLKKIARFSMKKDLRLTERAPLVADTSLPFLPDDPLYKPWRNYGRTFKLALLAASDGAGSQPTKLATLLAADGSITTDEYFHFLAEVTSDPSPALQGWDHTAQIRRPLLFALKFLLARASLGMFTTSINDVVAAYGASGLVGDEDHLEFTTLAVAGHSLAAVDRQAAESIQVIAQISYLSLEKRVITVSLSQADAGEIFQQLEPIGGAPLASGDAEIFRLTDLFEAEIDRLQLDYADTAVSDIEESGFSGETTFAEGRKTRKTHLVIERNGKIRSEFFKAKPSSVCDFCATDTGTTYPWVERILDVHHLLPLCSGARTSKDGTMLDDLVAICPTCHRGVHRYYDRWLKISGQKDFLDADQAKRVYDEAKLEFKATP
jgi:predicted HNH restriction endonuclease